MYKYFISTIFIISLGLSDQVDHNFDSVIMPHTKVPYPGRVNVDFVYGNAKYNSIYIENKSHSLPDNKKFKVSGYGINVKYHGVNGVGVEASLISEEFKFNNLENTYNDFYGVDIDASFTKSTSIFGIYFNWNEIFPHTSPSGLNSHQFTFPTTRIINGLYVQNVDIGTYSYSKTFGTFAMDFIVTKKCIISNKVLVDLALDDATVLDDDMSFSWLNSKIIYDINDNISVAPGFVYAVNKNGSYETFLLLEAGYQFADLSYGYFNSDIKLVPYLKLNVDGKNLLYANYEFGVSVHLLFN